MKRVKPWGLTVAVAAVLGSFALIYFNYFVNGTVDPPHAFRGAASTSGACRPCHRSIYDSYVKTGHYLTSTVATKATVMGDFGEGRNVARTSLPDLQFVMEERRGGFFQTAVYTKDTTETFTQAPSGRGGLWRAGADLPVLGRGQTVPAAGDVLHPGRDLDARARL